MLHVILSIAIMVFSFIRLFIDFIQFLVSIMSSLSNGIFNENQPLMEKLTHGYHPMTEGVRWSEKYADKIEHIFSKMPRFVTTILATFAVFILGTSLQGKTKMFQPQTDNISYNSHKLLATINISHK